MSGFMRPTLGRYLRVFFTLSDVVLYNLLFAVALHFTVLPDDVGKSVLWILVNVSYLGVIACNREIKHRDRAILLDRVVAETLVNIGLHALFFLALAEILVHDIVPLRLYVIYYSLLVVLLSIWNLIVRRSVKNYRRRGYNYKRVVIVGTNKVASRFLEQLESDPGYGYRMLGFFDNSIKDGFQYNGRYIGDIASLADFVKENHVDQIYYTRPNRDDGDMQAVVKIADDNGAEFFYVPHVKDTLGRDYTLLNVGAMPVLAGRRNPLKNPFNRFAKRSFDVVVSSVFLLLYPLIYLPIAIAIKLSSPGPVYFRQKRTGYRGESFYCLKFRTMHVNKDADIVQATENDPRKTRLGEFLRRTSLDELPQFINVWKGDMSIVGPRPHMLKHTEEYSKIVDRYMVRHLVKPGITGWAQVNGYRGPTDELWKMEKRVEFDVWYIEHWTYLLDLKIMVRTVINAFHGEENAR